MAGILFALLFGASLVLLRLTVPADPATATPGLQTQCQCGSRWRSISCPYAGIAFLWFIGVIRDRLGDMEDRLFATVFLGSGLMFLALIFVSGAMAGGLLINYAISRLRYSASRDVLIYSRSVMFRGDQRLCHSHGRRLHDLSGHHLVAHRCDAPRVGIYDLCAGARLALEHQLLAVGHPDLSGVGAWQSVSTFLIVSFRAEAPGVTGVA